MNNHSRRRLVLSAITALIAAMLAILGFSSPAEATHYRATQLTWHHHAGAPANQVEIHAEASWRCGLYFPAGCPAVGTQFFADPIAFGDGFFSNGQWTVLSTDPANEIMTIEQHATHNYSGPGPWTVAFDGCCRLSGPNHINNPDGTQRAVTIVNTAATSASPESSISPIVDCGLNSVCQFFVPGSDEDGQALRWRLATSAEAGPGGINPPPFVQPGPPHAANAATVDPVTGLYRWDTTGAALSTDGATFYSTQVIIENLNSAGAVITRTGVDFFIRLSSNTTNAPPVFVSPTPADGTTYDVAVGDSVNFNVAATDPDAADTVTPGIIGKPAAASFTTAPGNPATAAFSWTPTTAGTTLMTLTAQDQNGLGATQRSVTIRVVDNEPPEADAAGPYAGDEGDAIAISGAATDPDADPLTTTWSAAGAAGNDAGADCVFADPSSLATTVTCDDDGTWTLTLAADDGQGGTDSSNATLTVGNLDPSVSITSPADGALYPLGSTVTVNAAVDDPGGNDSVSCSTTWDGGGATDAGAEASGLCTAANTFTVPGVYTIRVTGTDGDGGSAYDEVMVVIYDPSSGFVTGGGWIDSAAGSYAADPALEGRANFGFVSKYKKGATVPDGQTEFQFHAGDLNVHSQVYQWLVVSGTRAQFKGTATVNGASGYGFLVTVTDGGKTGPDKFRIKVWRLSDGGTVYDNKMGASTDLDAADPQAIGGGAIVIHK